MRAFVFPLVFILCRIDPGQCQELMSIKPGKPIVCYQSFDDEHVRIGLSDKVRQLRQHGAGRTRSATIQVEYINFPANGEARDAFQYAVEIWETELTSSVPIRIRAEWRPLAAGVLGQAIWGSAYANFGGEQFMNVFYPVALAEKIVGHEINGTSEPDIFATFNSNAAWYFGTDGNTPSGRMDLVTIVLHEIAHGLGYTDTYNVRGADGTVGLQSGTSTLPFIFDLFVENQGNANLVRDFQSPSPALAAELQSSQLYFNSPLTEVLLDGTRPKLYSPSPFNSGSSISHLDEVTFSGPDDADRLMTPHIAFAESIHAPGEVLMASLADMGWVYTLIDHQVLRDTERKDGQPYPVRARIVSDNGYDPTTVRLHYTSDGSQYATVNMAPSGPSDNFEAELPGTTSDMAYAYYITVDDVDGRLFTNPGIRRPVASQPEQGLHYFRIGRDETPPEIVHSPVRHVGENDALVLTAQVTDNQGIAEVVVEYSVNGGSILTSVMEKGTLPDEYTVAIQLGSAAVDDEVRYRLIARDIAALENIAIDPVEDFYFVQVTGLLPVRESYFNDFDAPSTDFFGDAFSILTPSGFYNGAIHSNHPYQNGSGPNSESHYTYQLQIPIRISGENPIIRFDQIVLVEPGEIGSVFGDQGFYDYAVVEGSSDGGVTWKALAPGYDSRAHTAWLTRYNSSMSGDNSTAAGDPTLFQQKTIDMLASGDFSEGDEVLIRFRLFADQLANGWGWAIDNLAIQPPVTSIEDPNSHGMDVYPIPATDELFIDLHDVSNQTITIEIVDLTGRVLQSHQIAAHETTMKLVIDVRQLPAGLYFVKSGHHLRKFLKSKG